MSKQLKNKNSKTSKKNSPKKIFVSDAMEKSLMKAEQEIEEMEKETEADETTAITIKSSKPISQIKKGDKIKVDSLLLEVDAHYVLMDHGSTKEMAIECFDSKTNKEYQIRYFNDQINSTIEVYELQEIIYKKLKVKSVEW